MFEKLVYKKAVRDDDISNLIIGHLSSFGAESKSSIIGAVIEKNRKYSYEQVEETLRWLVANDYLERPWSMLPDLGLSKKKSVQLIREDIKRNKD